MRIKICGITRTEDARLALELGAWALGFIFYEKSPRFITPGNVRKILDELAADAKITAVTVGGVDSHSTVFDGAGCVF